MSCNIIDIDIIGGIGITGHQRLFALKHHAGALAACPDDIGIDAAAGPCCTTGDVGQRRCGAVPQIDIVLAAASDGGGQIGGGAVKHHIAAIAGYLHAFAVTVGVTAGQVGRHPCQAAGLAVFDKQVIDRRIAPGSKVGGNRAKHHIAPVNRHIGIF